MKFLFLAYTIFWIFLFGFIFRLSNKQKKLKKEVENLKENSE
jgi:CcmD family protein